MKKAVYKKIKDLFLDYQAILAGNGIGDLDLIVEQIKAIYDSVLTEKLIFHKQIKRTRTC